MKVKQLIVAVAVLMAAGSALADSDNFFEFSGASTTPSKTRAEVRAELVQARAHGLLDVNDLNYPIVPVAKSTKTRAQVKAELIQARAQGLLDIDNVNYPVAASTKSTAARVAVKSEESQVQSRASTNLNHIN